MTAPILALHPAPVRFVPAGGNRERLEFVQVATPVRVAEAAPGEFETIGLLRQSYESAYGFGPLVRGRHLHVRDGGLWIDLHDQGRPVTPADFAERIAGKRPYDKTNPTEWDRAFAGTPLLARDRGYDSTRGAPTLRVRRLVSDLSTRARTELARLLETDVAFVGDGVRIRLRTVGGHYAPPKTNELEPDDEFGRVLPSVFPRSHYFPGSVGELTDPEGVARRYRAEDRYREKQPLALPGPEGLANYLGIHCRDGFPFDLVSGSARRLFANSVHVWTLDLTRTKRVIARDDVADPVLAALDRSRAWQALGAISAVPDAEIGRCLDDFVELFEFLRATRECAHSHTLFGFKATLDDHVRPTAAPAEDEDVEAIASLAM